LRSNPPRGGRAPYGERSDGFTLVEVIVVLVILAILAAIAIPALTGYIDKANTSQIKAKARSAAVAMQTILSEAYADPQTQLPVGEDDSELYVDGKKMAFIATVDEPTFLSNTYRVSYSAPDDVDYVALVRKLDASAVIYMSGYYHLTIDVVFDEHFSILAYTYMDPETYGTTDMRICSYNYGSLADETYDASAGFKVWSVVTSGDSGDSGDSEYVLIG
jgi:prepilin-type N-terminal cleavage/methylation domain-containing protein